jgi:hypothetical protein
MSKTPRLLRCHCVYVNGSKAINIFSVYGCRLYCDVNVLGVKRLFAELQKHGAILPPSPHVDSYPGPQEMVQNHCKHMALRMSGLL